MASKISSWAVNCKQPPQCDAAVLLAGRVAFRSPRSQCRGWWAQFRSEAILGAALASVGQTTKQK